MKYDWKSLVKDVLTSLMLSQEEMASKLGVAFVQLIGMKMIVITNNLSENLKLSSFRNLLLPLLMNGQVKITKK